MTFQEFCSTLQQRLPVQIAALNVNERAVISLVGDPSGMCWQCVLGLPQLEQVETELAVRAIALGQVTVH